MTSIEAKRVAIAPTGPAYPVEPPYHPDEPFPEYPFPKHVSSRPNAVYRAVREVLFNLGLDTNHYGTAAWNPLGSLMRPGSRVVIKPNWVLHRNQGDGGTDCLVTHPSVLRAVLDYVFLARPSLVMVGDAPIQGCDWDVLLAMGFAQVLDFERQQGLAVSCSDFRRTVLHEEGDLKKVETNRKPLADFVEVDLGRHSLLEPISRDASKFRVTMYDPRKMRQNHAPGRHRYLVARDILAADVVINLPKLKTHKKAGLTAALKNLVGINGNKEYLPHHRKGSRSWGGDNYEKFSVLKGMTEEILDFANMFFLEKPRAYRFFTHLVYYLLVADMRLGGSGEVEGSWYGNDTVWRMCLDLNRLLLYADPDGQLQNQPVRLELNIADGVVAGQGEGPLKPHPLNLGFVVASMNPAALDWVAANLMFLDPQKIPIISHAFDPMVWPLCTFSSSQIECISGGSTVSLPEAVRRWAKPARPPLGWRGHCELTVSYEQRREGEP
jgi:uncharacterized protein (DUF362 family)